MAVHTYGWGVLLSAGLHVCCLAATVDVIHLPPELVYAAKDGVTPEEDRQDSAGPFPGLATTFSQASDSQSNLQPHVQLATGAGHGDRIDKKPQQTHPSAPGVTGYAPMLGTLPTPQLLTDLSDSWFLQESQTQTTHPGTAPATLLPGAAAALGAPAVNSSCGLSTVTEGRVLEMQPQAQAAMGATRHYPSRRPLSTIPSTSAPGSKLNRPASAPAASRSQGAAHNSMTVAQWKALPPEYWAKFGPSKDEVPYAIATEYDIKVTWDPATNTVKRTAKPDTFKLWPDEEERREHEYAQAAAANSVVVKELLAAAAAHPESLASAGNDLQGGSYAWASPPSPHTSPPVSPGVRPLSMPVLDLVPSSGYGCSISGGGGMSPTRGGSPRSRPASGRPAGPHASNSCGATTNTGPAAPAPYSRQPSAQQQPTLAATIWEEDAGGGCQGVGAPGARLGVAVVFGDRQDGVYCVGSGSRVMLVCCPPAMCTGTHACRQRLQY